MKSCMYSQLKRIIMSMYSWYIKIILIAYLCLSICALSQNSTDIQWRTIYMYIIPEDSDSLISCHVDCCYHLEDVFSNSSYFFDSYTTLELLPGVYAITEKVGQLVLIVVKNFTLRGSSSNVTIICQPSASFGLTIIHSQNVEISNIQISHCSARLQLEESNDMTMITYHRQLKEYIEGLEYLQHSDLRYNSSTCDASTSSHPVCYTFLVSFRNKEFAIFETAILYSKGVGIFLLVSGDLDMSRSLLAYNLINCMIIVLGTTNTTFNMSQCQKLIEFGQIKSQRYKFASGMNLFMHVTDKMHNIHLRNITLTNNGGAYGNLYLAVSAEPMHYDREDIYVNIRITNMMSIQTSAASPGYGLVVKYKIRLGKYESSTSSWPLPCKIMFSLFDPDSYPWLSFKSGPIPDLNLWSKTVDIVLQNIHFLGSCVTIIDSELFTRGQGMWFWFAMNNITIKESRCLTALSVLYSDVIQLSDLAIVNSHNDILLVILASEYSTLVLSGNTSFLANQGSVLLLSGTIEFNKFVLISGNNAHSHESIVQISNSSHVYFMGETFIVNNTGRQGGAISAHSSGLYFDGNVSFVGNSAGNGGAISLKEGATINLKAGARILFQSNVADRYGGAIYVEDSGFWVRSTIKCFVHVWYVNGEDGYVEFENNRAGIAGASLFGGWIDLCETENSKRPSSLFNFKENNSVASIPTGVFMCTNSTLDKYVTEAYITLFPGQTFEIEVVAVGQRFGMISASIRAETTRNDVIDQLQKVQDAENSCTKLEFTVRSSNKNETITLSIDGRIIPRWINASIPDEFLQFKILITLEDCPLGFEFDNRRNICSCHPYLDTYGVQCNFTTYTVNRNAQQWIGVLNPSKTVVVHRHCPYDYCKSYALSLNLSTPDIQCSSSRSGVLCGACQPGLSQVLGTSNCKKCSNIWLLLMFVFALAGMLLVTGLIKLNITVTTGTINGLIFYANIVRANTATFFPKNTANSFHSWFIAWLNLDVGVETCLYDGLDAYMKAWLQFAFPLYIWLLATLIIILSKYSWRAARIFGADAVQVLATLFHLSYAKLLQLTITIFQPTHLLDNRNVWYFDGNVAYLGKRHALLMLVALLFFVLFLLPYTLILFGIQWLQIFSHYKPFHWVNKLKPLFDAYTGPYKDKHRYWTGLLLLVRIGLFIVFFTNTSGDPAINLLAIIIVIICLFVYLAMFGGVYKIWLLNLLEYSSLLNLVILSIVMLYTTSTDKSSHILSQVSVSITLCTFMLITGYHGLVVILKAIKLDLKVTAIWRNKKTNSQPSKITDQMQQHNAMLKPPVTCSVIELTEPLLEC